MLSGVANQKVSGGTGHHSSVEIKQELTKEVSGDIVVEFDPTAVVLARFDRSVLMFEPACVSGLACK